MDQAVARVEQREALGDPLERIGEMAAQPADVAQPRAVRRDVAAEGDEAAGSGIRHERPLDAALAVTGRRVEPRDHAFNGLAGLQLIEVPEQGRALVRRDQIGQAHPGKLGRGPFDEGGEGRVDPLDHAVEAGEKDRVRGPFVTALKCRGEGAARVLTGCGGRRGVALRALRGDRKLMVGGAQRPSLRRACDVVDGHGSASRLSRLHCRQNRSSVLTGG